jgi:glycosyltransferase involved in cell wall biosynthesis
MLREYVRHGVQPDRIHKVGCLVTAKPIHPREHHPFRGELLFLGRLTELKGVEYLLNALEILRRQFPLRLTVAGDGPEVSKLRAIARAKSLDVHFAGWVAANTREELLQRTDLLVVPSVWPEPFGLVGLEAAAAGVPSVAFDVGGISEWLVPGVTGELAPGNPPTSAGLAAAIARAVVSPEHWKRLGENARSRANTFSNEEHVGLVEQMLVQASGAERA